MELAEKSVSFVYAGIRYSGLLFSWGRGLIFRIDRMKRLSFIFPVVMLALFFYGCVGKGTPIYVLGVPRFVPQSEPDSLIQSGIGQDPMTGGIYLQWYTVNNAAGYRLYRSDTTNASGNPIDFTLIANVSALRNSNDTSTVDENSLSAHVTYYYFLVAYSADGTSSSPSDTINFGLLERPLVRFPAANASISASGASFSWYDPTGGGYTVVRIENITRVPNVTIWVTKRFQVFDSYPVVSFDFDSTATQPLLSGNSYQWRVDRFQVNAIGRPYEGSTSPWWTFTVK